MNPLLFLAVIAGGIAGTFTNVLMGSGLVAAASPGSIVAVLGMTARGSHFGVILGVLVGAAVSFAVAALILKTTKVKDSDEEFDAKVQESQNLKSQSKGQTVTAPVTGSVSDVSDQSVSKIIFACDAGMGSSAMGASLMRKKVKEAGLDIPVTNSSISNLKEEDGLLVITQEELTDRASQKTPGATHVSVDNFLSSPKYDEVIKRLKEQ